MPRRQQMVTVVLPIGQKETRRREIRYRDAFARLWAGMHTRPEPRGVFDRIACGRVRPWENVMVPIRLAIVAGQSEENALEPIREMEREVRGYFAKRDGDSDPAALLAAEALREAHTREPKVRALVSRTPADLLAAADAIEREAHADLECAAQLRIAAGLYYPHSTTRTARRARRVARRETAMGAVEVVK